MQNPFRFHPELIQNSFRTLSELTQILSRTHTGSIKQITMHEAQTRKSIVGGKVWYAGYGASVVADEGLEGSPREPFPLRVD